MALPIPDYIQIITTGDNNTKGIGKIGGVGGKKTTLPKKGKHKVHKGIFKSSLHGRTIF